MALSPDQKKKAKRKLFELADDRERSEILMLETETVQEQIDALNKTIAEGSLKKEMAALLQNMSQGMERMRSAYLKGMQEVSNTFKEHQEEFLKSLEGMHGTLKNKKEQDVSGFFKDLGTLLAEGNAHSKKTSDIITNLKWNSSMQIRNKEGSPMTPHAIAPAIGIGNGTITTAGTAVQISTTSVPTTRVFICNNDSNSSLTNNGTIVVGDSTVVAAAATRKGQVIYAGNYVEFYVSDLNLLWVDSLDNSAKFHYFYEKPF